MHEAENVPRHRSAALATPPPILPQTALPHVALHEAVPLQAGARICFPWGCHPQLPKALPHPPAPSPTLVPGSRTGTVVAAPPHADVSLNKTSHLLSPTEGFDPSSTAQWQLSPSPQAPIWGIPSAPHTGQILGTRTPRLGTPAHGEPERGEALGGMEASSNCLLNYSGMALTYK